MIERAGAGRTRIPRPALQKGVTGLKEILNETAGLANVIFEKTLNPRKENEMKKTHETRSQSEKLFGLLRVERECAQRQEASVPKGLSPAQVCEWLTRGGAFTGRVAASRIETDVALASEHGRGVTEFAPRARHTSAAVYILPRNPRLTLAPVRVSLAA